MNTPDEYCPFCDARVISRERRPNGNAVCEIGHTFPATAAALAPTPPAKTPSELHAEWKRVVAALGDGIADAVEQAEADAVRKERAAVVAWLRAKANTDRWVVTATAYHLAADAIERGDHHREEVTP